MTASEVGVANIIRVAIPTLLVSGTSGIAGLNSGGSGGGGMGWSWSRGILGLGVGVLEGPGVGVGVGVPLT